MRITSKIQNIVLILRQYIHPSHILQTTPSKTLALIYLILPCDILPILYFHFHSNFAENFAPCNAIIILATLGRENPGENQNSSSFTWKISCDSATAPPTKITIPRTNEMIPLPVIPNMKLEYAFLRNPSRS